jgi:hypothetical protein
MAHRGTFSRDSTPEKEEAKNAKKSVKKLRKTAKLLPGE